MRFARTKSILILKALVLGSIALLVGACDTDSPTEPQQQPVAPSPGTVPPSTIWTVELTASPNRIGIDGVNNFTSTITVAVRRADNGQTAPDGATVVMSTSFGSLTNAAGTVGASVPVGLTGGRGIATLSGPGTQAGTVVVQAQIEDSFGQTTVVLEELPEPDVLFIESVSPNRGSPSGGTRVNIVGSGFDTPVRVFFGGIPGTVESVSPNRVVAVTPAIDLPTGDLRTVAVQVTINVNEAGTATDTLGNAFTYTRNGNIIPDVDPRIISVTPRSGPNEGGTQVTIFGEGFSNVVQVFFGNGGTAIEAQVRDVSSTRLIVVTPSATGPNSANRDSIVSLQVVNVDTGRQASFPAAFQYGSPDQQVVITSIAPSEGLYLGGDIVTLFGQGFDEPVAVGLAGVGASIISVSGTEIVVRSEPVEIANCADVTGASSVVNIETGSGDGAGPSWTYEVFPPVVTGVVPSTVSGLGGGQNIEVFGAGFFPPINVTLGFPSLSLPVAVDLIDSTNLRFQLPPSPEAFPTVDCDDDGDGNAGVRDQPLFVNLTVTNPFTSCTTTVENAIVYEPTDTTCQGDDGGGAGLDPLVASFVVSTQIDSTTDEFVVQATNTSTPADYTDVSFVWDFGDGSPVETTVNPLPHRYPLLASESTASIVLNARRGTEPPSAPAIESITIPALGDTTPPPPPPPVGDPPVASFTFEVSGLDVDFTNTSTNIQALSTITWNFGDGTSANTINPPLKTYDAAGTYSVTLTIDGPNGTDSDTQDVTVP